jgi:predicted ArsR family transcriptional regulator
MQEVYECVYNNGPMTASEAFEILGLQTNQSGRLTDLRNRGVLEENGKRKCSITGRRAILWQVTGALPKKIKARSTKDKKIEALKIIRHIKDNAMLSGADVNNLSTVEETIKEL